METAVEENLHEPGKVSTTQGARPSGLRAGAERKGLAEEARSLERPKERNGQLLGRAWGKAGHRAL